jgi:hypothetical protein
MIFECDHALSLLSMTPKVLRAMLEDLPSEWTTANEGAKTWSAFDVVGHLIHGERTDWLPRMRIILEHGESRPFESFDRFAQFKESTGRSLEELLGTFESLRSENLRMLNEAHLNREDLARTGTHPELGRVTLEELLATWVVHDLDHIVQISRTLAKQYREAVGPWKEFLSVLDPR